MNSTPKEIRIRTNTIDPDVLDWAVRTCKNYGISINALTKMSLAILRQNLDNGGGLLQNNVVQQPKKDIMGDVPKPPTFYAEVPKNAIPVPKLAGETQKVETSTETGGYSIADLGL